MIIQNICKDRILILDFGSQYTRLIAKRIRTLGVYCEIYDWNVKKKNIFSFKPNGIILSGGPDSVVYENTPQISKSIFSARIPILGICYGMHVMAIQLGGLVIHSKKSEFGYAKVQIQRNSKLINNIQDGFNKKNHPFLNTWMSHSDEVSILPKGFKSIANTLNCDHAIISDEKNKLYGIQFHPEVTQTEKGLLILKRFIINICNCKKIWIPSKITNTLINDLKIKIKKDFVILGLSGGIDSTVTAILLKKAIKNRLICIFVNNGLLRFKEEKYIKEIFKKHLNLKIVYVNAKNRFFQGLKNVVDPEKKRKIIGEIFINIFYEEAAKFDNIKWLAQGTIYPDIIESSHSKNKFIKSHHNVGGLPLNLKFRLIEPLKTLFKDEVKEIAKELNIPNVILERHPFPGPGLAIRILGEVKKEYCDILKKADAIFLEEIKKANLYKKISQAFAIFLPLKSVSVMGDNRKYEWIIALRAIETSDFMTAKWKNFSYSFLKRISNRIINEVHGISRVVYDISDKPPSTIEWE